MKKCLSVFLMLSLVFLIILSAACDSENGDAQGNTRNGGISIVNTPDGAMMYKFEYIDLLTDDDYLIEYNIGNPSLEAGKSWNNSLYFLQDIWEKPLTVIIMLNGFSQYMMNRQICS